MEGAAFHWFCICCGLSIFIDCNQSLRNVFSTHRRIVIDVVPVLLGRLNTGVLIGWHHLNCCIFRIFHQSTFFNSSLLVLTVEPASVMSILEILKALWWLECNDFLFHTLATESGVWASIHLAYSGKSFFIVNEYLSFCTRYVVIGLLPLWHYVAFKFWRLWVDHWTISRSVLYSVYVGNLVFTHILYVVTLFQKFYLI